MSPTPERLLVVARHEPPSYPPIRVEPGETVTVGRADDEWPAFCWVTRTGGAGGWVPARHLERTGPGAALVRRAYDTTELAAEPGDAVFLLEDDRPSGWAWCRKAGPGGAEGWLPRRCLGAA